jgi:hypothetical protein
LSNPNQPNPNEQKNEDQYKKYIDAMSPIDLGVVLSSLDGVGNYNGLIIVATTNCIEKIDKAIYRDMRLTPMEFKQMRKIDCQNVIKMYFGECDDVINNIIVDRKITPSKLVFLCSTYNHLPIREFATEILSPYFT